LNQYNSAKKKDYIDKNNYQGLENNLKNLSTSPSSSDKILCREINNNECSNEVKSLGYTLFAEESSDSALYKVSNLTCVQHEKRGDEITNLS